MQRYATLRYATLRYATLLSASLRYATLRYATLRYATLLSWASRNNNIILLYSREDQLLAPQLPEEEGREHLWCSPTDGKAGKERHHGKSRTTPRAGKRARKRRRKLPVPPSAC